MSRRHGTLSPGGLISRAVMIEPDESGTVKVHFGFGGVYPGGVTVPAGW